MATTWTFSLFGSLLAVACCTAFSGCGFASQSQVCELKATNRSLGEQSQAQISEIENLRSHAHKLEDKLLAAEQDLQEYEQQLGIDRKKIASLRHERTLVSRHLLGNKGVRIASPVNNQLAQLAREFPSLNYDPATGISKLDIDVLFDSGKVELKAGAKQMLKQFAGVLNSHEAKDLNVIVVGHTDDQRIRDPATREKYPDNWSLGASRAMAVARELRDSGLPGEKMGIASYASHQPLAQSTTEENRQRNRRVEIFLTAPNVPVVGMTETMSKLYR